ncbi:MAG: RNA polymerase factor sigma-54 [Phycisphaeraceae bacterium]
MRIDQRMKLAPRMIQSMEILQLPMQALEARIEQELTSNPTLELREPGTDPDAEVESGEGSEPGAADNGREKTEGEKELVVKDETVDKSQSDDFERLSNMAEEYGESWSNNYEGESYRKPAPSLDRDPKMEAMANTAARPPSEGEQLLDQWHLTETTPEIRAAGEYLIGFIDEDGYLRTDEQSLLSQAPPGMTAEQLRTALSLIQTTIEPVGIGARDLRECLLLQIDARNGQPGAHDLSVERLLVSDYLKDIEVNRLPRIAEKTGLPIDRIKQAITNLRQFHPHPGRLLEQENPRTISPDAVIEYDEVEDRYTATLTHERLPSVHINHRYLRMARDPSIDRKTREFVGNNLRSARWLIDAIQQRHSTLLRVINVVIEAQRDFFDLGPQHLKPLPMTLVADQLGIHVATVSRAVSEKYVMTPRGVLPLRMFFSGGTETQGGDAMSWAAVQAKLEEIIGAEDKGNPLSDDHLVEELKKHGIDIARRTVAKYRKQLSIAPARQRKQF